MNEKQKEKGRPCLFPGTVEEKVYCRYKGEQGNPEESVEETTRLSQTKMPGIQRADGRDQETKMLGLYKEGQLGEGHQGREAQSSS